MGGVQGGQPFHYVHCCAGDRISGQGSGDGDSLRFPVDGVGVDGQLEGACPPHLAGGDGHLESGGGSGVIIRPGGAVPHRHGHRNRLRQRDGAFREGGGDGDGSGGASFHNRLRVDAEGYGGGNGVGVGEGETGVGDGETGGRPRHRYRLRTFPGHIIIGPRQTERVGTAGPARGDGDGEIIHRRIVGSFTGSVVGLAHRHGHLRIGGQNGRPRREGGCHRHHRRTIAFRQGGGTRAEADGPRGGVAVGQGHRSVGDGETGGRPRHGYGLRTFPGHIIIGPRQTERVGTAGPARGDGDGEIVHRRIVGSRNRRVVGRPDRHRHRRVPDQGAGAFREGGGHRNFGRGGLLGRAGRVDAQTDGSGRIVAVGQSEGGVRHGETAGRP